MTDGDDGRRRRTEATGDGRRRRMEATAGGDGGGYGGDGQRRWIEVIDRDDRRRRQAEVIDGDDRRRGRTEATDRRWTETMDGDTETIDRDDG